MHPVIYFFGLNFVAKEKHQFPTVSCFQQVQLPVGDQYHVGAKARHMKKEVAHSLPTLGSSAGIADIWHTLQGDNLGWRTLFN